MAYLKKTWLLEDNLDYEYKQYQLLGYLKEVDEKFDNLMLYPDYANIIDHMEALRGYKKSVPDIVKLNEKYFSDFDKLIHFATQKMNDTLIRGLSLYFEVMKIAEITNLTQNVLNKKGFIIVSSDKSLIVYEYNFLNTEDGKGVLNTKPIRYYPNSSELTYQSVSQDIYSKDLPIYHIDNTFNYPIDETLLPIVKHKIIKRLTQQ